MNVVNILLNLPRREGEDHKFIPILNEKLFQKMSEWKKENSRFKEIVQNLVQKIISSTAIPNNEKKKFFQNKKCTIENGYNLNLDAFKSSTNERVKVN
jgi:hypothetical protein